MGNFLPGGYLVLTVASPGCNPGTTPSREVHFGRDGQELEIGLWRVTTLVEWTEVGEGGEGFHIVQTGERPDYSHQRGVHCFYHGYHRSCERASNYNG